MELFIRVLPVLSGAGRLMKTRFFEILPGLRAFSGSVNAAVLLLVVALLAETSFSVSPRSQTEVVFGGPEDRSLSQGFTIEASAATIEGGIFDHDHEGHESDSFASLSAGVATVQGAPLFPALDTAGDDEGYQVLPGDTLESLALRHSIPLKELARINGLKADAVIFAGDIIRLPHHDSAEEQVAVTIARNGYLPDGFIWPVAGQIRLSAPHGRFNSRDIPGKLGTPVIASGDGFVYAAAQGWNGGYGNYVLLSHPQAGVQTMYAHLEYAVVVPGEKVRQGQTIGYMGSTGRSTGSHVHFEVRP